MSIEEPSFADRLVIAQQAQPQLGDIGSARRLQLEAGTHALGQRTRLQYLVADLAR
jgi:hypothetical protein